MFNSPIYLISISIVLSVSAIFHLLLPELATDILAEGSSIRVIGILLVILGLPALFHKSIYSKVVGVLVFFSGFGRAIDPDRFIAINMWTDKFVHGILLGVGAVLVILVVLRINSVSKADGTST